MTEAEKIEDSRKFREFKRSIRPMTDRYDEILEKRIAAENAKESEKK